VSIPGGGGRKAGSATSAKEAEAADAADIPGGALLAPRASPVNRNNHGKVMNKLNGDNFIDQAKVTWRKKINRRKKQIENELEESADLPQSTRSLSPRIDSAPFRPEDASSAPLRLVNETNAHCLEDTTRIELIAPNW
jgi:hypothetical protein